MAEHPDPRAGPGITARPSRPASIRSTSLMVGRLPRSDVDHTAGGPRRACGGQGGRDHIIHEREILRAPIVLVGEGHVPGGVPR